MTTTYKVVNVNLIGEPIELYRTIWRFSGREGDRFDNVEAAQAALDKAKQFMPAKLFKASRDMGKIGKLLGGKSSLEAHLHHNGQSPAGVTFPLYPSAFAVLMPIRTGHTAPDTAWKDAVAA
jgi:hypothetical protein